MCMVGVCVSCVCQHYEDRACAVHTGGTVSANLLKFPALDAPQNF